MFHKTAISNYRGFSIFKTYIFQYIGKCFTARVKQV